MSETSPFAKRTVLLLIAVGVVAMLGFLLVSAYGDRVDRQRSNIPSPTSGFATGFKALYRLIPLSGGKAWLSEGVHDRPDGLLILTPNAQTQGSEIIGALADREGPTLIVLPKHITVRDRKRPTRELRYGTIPDHFLDRMLADLGKVTTGTGDEGPLTYARGLPLRPFIVGEGPQTVHGEGLTTLIGAPGGGAVLARLDLPDRTKVDVESVYILADPDLLNNAGLANKANARAAIAMLAALDTDHPGQVAFDTMLPFGAGGRNLLQLMFEPPFVGVSIALFIAALLAGIAAFARFGPIWREPRALAFGKRALIDNIVGLARRADRTREGGNAFADTIRDWAARHLALPRTLQGEALDTHLDRLETETSYAEWTDRLRHATSEAEMLHAAQKLDDWRKEVKA
jgi:hypothetical protein